MTMTRQRKKLMSLIEPDIDSGRKSGSMKQKVNERRRRSQHKIKEIFTAGGREHKIVEIFAAGACLRASFCLGTCSKRVRVRN